MGVTIISGMQWGDEGKGHITHHLAQDAYMVARANGGPNAGHTIHVDGQVFKTHQLPAGVLYPEVISLLGSGMVINLESLATEIDTLGDRIVPLTPERLLISFGAHLITPGHILLDGAMEQQRGAAAIGTTKRGIGPVHADKALHNGLRAELLKYPNEFERQLRAHLIKVNLRLQYEFVVDERVEVDQVVTQYLQLAERFSPHVVDGVRVVRTALSSGKHVVAEGAQGTLLDIDHGTYPYVSSGSAVTGGIMASLGLGVKDVYKVIGVVKAFSTRVGAGPFPTEVDGDVAKKLRGERDTAGSEYGTTTGRPRRIGWLDLVALRHACAVNQPTSLVITKLDQLSGIQPLQLCHHYKYQSQPIEGFPSDGKLLEQCQPTYWQMEGWDEDISDVRYFRDLPASARDYLQVITEFTRTPIQMISVGPNQSNIFTK